MTGRSQRGIHCCGQPQSSELSHGLLTCFFHTSKRHKLKDRHKLKGHLVVSVCSGAGAFGHTDPGASPQMKDKRWEFLSAEVDAFKSRVSV